MNTTQEEIHFVLASDQNYLPHAGTLIRSICENNVLHKLYFHLMTMDKRVPEDRKLKDFFDAITSDLVQTEVILIGEDDPFISACPSGGVVSNRSTYLRFLAPLIIPVDKLIYLDCDMIALDDLGELYQTDLGDKIFGAVPELFAGAFIFAYGFGMRYFNAGMLLINAKKWREEHCSEKAIRFVHEKFAKLFEGKKHYGDQDILNMLFQGQVVYLHPKYNLVNPVLLRKCYFSGEIFDEAVKRPAIVHFAGSSKPWNTWDDHPLTEKYVYYREQTPWNEIPVQKKTTARLLKYCFRKLKYNAPWLIYPAADIWRRLLGYHTRVVKGELIEYLMAETKVLASEE